MCLLFKTLGTLLVNSIDFNPMKLYESCYRGLWRLLKFYSLHHRFTLAREPSKMWMHCKAVSSFRGTLQECAFTTS